MITIKKKKKVLGKKRIRKTLKAKIPIVTIVNDIDQENKEELPNQESFVEIDEFYNIIIDRKVLLP